MAENHRRVEPRSIVGTGMATDPDRVEALQHDRERMERTWRAPPRRGFGEVLEEAPPLVVPEEPEDRRRRKRGEARATDDEEANEAKANGASTSGEKANDADTPSAMERGSSSKPLPRVPPDPRMRQLHAQLEAARPKNGPRGNR